MYEKGRCVQIWPAGWPVQHCERSTSGPIVHGALVVVLVVIFETHTEFQWFTQDYVFFGRTY